MRPRNRRAEFNRAVNNPTGREPEVPSPSRVRTGGHPALYPDTGKSCPLCGDEPDSECPECYGLGKVSSRWDGVSESRRRTMRVTESQLRKLIRTEVVRRLHEGSLGGDTRGQIMFIQDCIETVREQWVDMYNEGDPSMEALGEQAWQEQVEQACEALEEKWLADLNEVFQALTNGEYYGDQGPDFSDDDEVP